MARADRAAAAARRRRASRRIAPALFLCAHRAAGLGGSKTNEEGAPIRRSAPSRTNGCGAPTPQSVAAAKDFVGSPGPIRSSTAIGRLGDSEWGWIASAIIWGWVATRSEQAAAEGWGLEELSGRPGLSRARGTQGRSSRSCRSSPRPVPTSTGRSLPAPGRRRKLAKFLLTAFDLIQRATIARDVVEEQIAQPTSADVTARQINAAAGNPRMTPAELKALDDGDCPF